MIIYLKKIPNNTPAIIHSDLLSFRRKITSHPQKIKKDLLNHFKKGIFIPCFVLEKKKLINFDKFDHTLGGMTNLFIKDRQFKRTINPIHSYIYNYKEINENSFMYSSFGNNSIFNFFTKKNFIWINLGADFNSGFTIFHYIEEMCNVEYRKKIVIKKKILFKRKIYEIKYNYFSRKKKIIYNFNKLVNKMIDKNILKKITLQNGKSITYGHCKKIVDFAVKELKKNKKFLINS
jgi:aminoglycoside N3'-acetyltransferase